MGRKITLRDLAPEGVDRHLWIQFINDHCFKCESPKEVCASWDTVVGQAVKCFEEWRKREQSREEAGE